MVSTFKLPFIVKASIFLMGLYVFITMLYVAQGIIIPLLFSTFLAILLHPVVSFLVRKKFNRLLAISLVLALAFVLLAGIGFLMYSQIIQLSDSLPKFITKLTETFNQSIGWISEYFNINPEKITSLIADSKEDMMNNSNSTIGKTLLSVGSGIVVLFIIPVYIFMILYYKPLLMEFLHQLFGENNHSEVSEIIAKIKSVIQRYLSGLVIEAVIVAVLNTTALFALGIEYAILLGIVGAILNVIPYIGGIVGVALPMMVALATESSPWYAVYILVLYYIIQLIDNNFIVPKIVASKVKVNALVSIVVILAFGALWGIPGMFISIPVTAIIKVIFDHIKSLKPWGYLLGDTMPSSLLFKVKFIKKVIKKK